MARTRQLIEAALFMSPKPLSLSDLYDLTRAELSELRLALNELIAHYNDSESALEVAETNTGYQLKVRSDFEESVSHLASTSRFSKGVMKTLAFIAYKQPIKQSTLVKYRTTNAYHEIKFLEERGYITREPDDNTYTIRTTKKFLREFGNKPVVLKERTEPLPAQVEGDAPA